jgi:hypothetical protein
VAKKVKLNKSYFEGNIKELVNLPKNCIGVGDCVDKISICNLKVWHLEEACNKTEDMAERGRFLTELRANNRERVAWIHALNKMTGTGFWNDKVNHLSKIERI